MYNCYHIQNTFNSYRSKFNRGFLRDYGDRIKSGIQCRVTSGPDLIRTVLISFLFKRETNSSFVAISLTKRL